MPTLEQKRERMKRYRLRRKARGLPTIRGKLKPTMRHWLQKGIRDRRSWDLRHQVEFNITIDYLMKLYETQNGRCALTGIELTYQLNNLNSASIDRIDSAKGHIEGNVQLVCVWVNYAKNKFSNEAMKECLTAHIEANAGKLLKSIKGMEGP